MTQIFPFRAWRPAPGLASRVASAPYDVVTSAEARFLARDNPLSFFAISRPEIALPAGTDEHDAAVYEQGARAWAERREQGVFVRDPHAALWLYAQQRGTHRQVGLVACVAVADYDQDIVKKHEKTRADKEDDRARHINALDAHDEPVFLTYRAEESLQRLTANVPGDTPLEDFVADDGVRHTTWAIPAERTAAIVDAFATKIPALYVADGHHRSAAASRVHALRTGQPGTHDRFLAVLFPHNELCTLPYNRLLRDPRRRSPEQLRQAVATRFDLRPVERPGSVAPQHFGLFLGSQWYEAATRAGDLVGRDLVASLDVSLCQDLLLAEEFGVVDPRRAANVAFVGGIHGAEELERRVQRDPWDVAVLLAPTPISQLLDVSDAGLLMPPKSTWFEPKLRSGLFVHAFGEGAL